MKITLDIQDSRFNTFLAFIKTLDYVSVKKEEIPMWQQDEVENRLKLIEKGEMGTRNWEDAKEDIFKN